MKKQTSKATRRSRPSGGRPKTNPWSQCIGPSYSSKQQVQWAAEEKYLQGMKGLIVDMQKLYDKRLAELEQRRKRRP